MDDAETQEAIRLYLVRSTTLPPAQCAELALGIMTTVVADRYESARGALEAHQARQRAARPAP
jgi:hypothetical protein